MAIEVPYEKKIAILKRSINLMYIGVLMLVGMALVMKYMGQPVELAPIFLLGLVEGGVAFGHQLLIKTKSQKLLNFLYNHSFSLITVLFVTMVVHYSGGIMSPLVLFYLFPIFIDSALYSMEKGVYSTVLSVTAFVTLGLFEYFVFSLPQIPGVNPYHLFPMVSGQLTSYTALFWLVGLAVGIFSTQLAAGRQELARTVDSETRVRTHSSELQEAYKKLEQAYAKLKELDTLKSDFISTVSHELRTPLTSIRAFAEILSANPQENIETKREFLNIINNESQRLTNLINDILDIAKIEEGKMEWRRELVSLGSVIADSLAAVSAWAKEKGLSLAQKVEGKLPDIIADRDRMMQVMENLLGNAIRYTEKGGLIEVKAQRVGREIQVSVSDTGRGIAKGDLEGIFEKFSQIKDTLTGKPKTGGLGLSITKGIVEHFSGRISVESQEGKGSTFAFTLPVPTQEDIEQLKEAEIKPRLVGVPSGRKVLVVDDEPNIRRFLNYELTKGGYQVLEAGTGKEALDKARELSPSLIIMDVKMPDINGFDVAAVIRNDSSTQNIPIIITSITEEREKGLRVGANDFVVKPINRESLLEKVASFLGPEKRKVLVVDDDEGLLEIISHILKEQGYEVLSALDGKEALEKTKEGNPDIIILDIKLPVMDGYEVIRALKKEDKTRDIPVIVLTGVDIKGGKARALSLGVKGYLRKEEGMERLLQEVEETIKEEAL